MDPKYCSADYNLIINFIFNPNLTQIRVPDKYILLVNYTKVLLKTVIA